MLPGALVLGVAATLAAALASDDPEQARASGALAEFSSCEELDAYVRRHEDSSSGPPIAMMEMGDVAAAAPVTGRVSDPGELTNVQEAGIDEPDVVKSDGVRVFALERDDLHVLVLDGGELVRTGVVELPGKSTATERELLVSGDRVLVVGTTAAYAAKGPRTLFAEVDVSDLAAPSVARTMRVEGSYLSARMNGAVARVVTASAPAYPQPVLEDSPGTTVPGVGHAVPTLRARDHVTGETVERPVSDCEDVEAARPIRRLGHAQRPHDRPRVWHRARGHRHGHDLGPDRLCLGRRALRCD